MTSADVTCRCGTQLSATAKYCSECGVPVRPSRASAEYKQVTVLFADVVRSMDIASTVGPERMREIMAELADRCSAVVLQCGGTVNQFTGDGIMAVFGAPIALEDHAVRACLAALGIQEEADRLAVDVRNRDGVDLSLRVGLNSGRVIAGEIGTRPFGYTAIGEQVGMAERMESVASPGGVMLSASTARLVEGTAALGERELVRIKGAREPVPAHRLIGMAEHRGPVRRTETNLVGRGCELRAVDGLLNRAIDGHGSVVSVVGPPGIGKSRLVREISAIAASRGFEVFVTFCESHTSQIPFHAVSRLLRVTNGVEGLSPRIARDWVRRRHPDAASDDMLLLDDLLGIADPDVELPQIDPDARRRRLTALVNAAWLARGRPAVYVVEDAHWIDSVSESMFFEFLAVIARTPSLVVITYRPEYEGALALLPGLQTIGLEPLSDEESTALMAELLGSDTTVEPIGRMINERAAGTPYFAEEIVRELAERGVLRGRPGEYASTADVAEIIVPATLEATIAARIDRLNPMAKRTLCAAAVIGARFGADLLADVGVDPAVDALVSAHLIDQVVARTGRPECVFHHPMIRAVAYESQLKAERNELHRRVAAAIEARDPGSADEKAALIADHLESAGDLQASYRWHMRAGNWLTHRDIAGARVSWERARQVADRLPVDDPGRMAMRIAPRTLLCATAWRVGGSLDDDGFDELNRLASAAGDKTSAVMGMTGHATLMQFHGKYREASQLASHQVQLLDSIADPRLTVGLSITPVIIKWATGEAAEALRLSQRVIDASGGDPVMGNLILGSPLAFALALRASSRCCLGLPGWRVDFDEAVALARRVDKFTFCAVVMFKYIAIESGALVSDDDALQDTAEALEIAAQIGDDFGLTNAEFTRGIVLVRHSNADRDLGFTLLHRARQAALDHRNLIVAAWCVDIELAMEKNRAGDYDGAIDLCKVVLDREVAAGEMTNRGWCTSVLVEALLNRGRDEDVDQAHAAVARLAATPVDTGFVYHQLHLLRLDAMLSRARGDDVAYRDYRDRYRAMSTSLGFEGHKQWAEAMT